MSTLPAAPPAAPTAGAAARARALDGLPHHLERRGGHEVAQRRDEGQGSGRHDLVLLCIEPARVRAEIRYEALVTDESFPHIYGPLNLEAVERVLEFPLQADGTFQLPPGI